MDDLVFLLKGERVGIKLDIEGGEYKAILGGNVFFEQASKCGVRDGRVLVS